MEYHDVLHNISLIAGWVFKKCIKFGLEEEHTRYNDENINNSDLDGMSLASFCQSRAAYMATVAVLQTTVSLNDILF